MASSMSSLVLLLVLLPAATACFTWLRATAKTSGAWTPGRQGRKPLGVCRYISLDTAPMGVYVGKWAPPYCYFTAQGPGLPFRKNGTASIADGYDVAAEVDCYKCSAESSVTISKAGQALPVDAVLAGFRADGSSLGVCLVPDGEGKGSLIPGQLYLSGSRHGQCCWSAGFLEQCRDHSFRVVTAKPVLRPVPPHIPPEPIPELLEPHARIFSVRLSFGPRGDPGIMGLTFETPNNTFAKLPHYAPSVWWATSLDALSHGGAETARCSHSVPRKCYTDSPVAHYCNMTGLKADTTYFYVIGDTAVGRTSASAKYSFKTPPVLGARGPLRTTAVVYGDMGLDYSDRTRALLAELATKGTIDFFVHNGDISYADNRISQRTKPGVAPSIYIDWMDLYYANISAYAGRIPYMLSPGNHEGPCNYGEYEARAAMMPFHGANSTDMQYYSYTVGQTHVVALSGESCRLCDVNKPELQWLEKDLAAAAAARDRGEVTFIITHVHYPNEPTGYCSSKMKYCCANGNVGLRSEPEGTEHFEKVFGAVQDGEMEGNACVDHFMTPVNKYAEDLFVKYGVDVHITAHQHVYERTTPVYRYKAYGNGSEPFPAGNDGSVFVNPKYPINVNNGNPGNVELQDVWMPRPEWSVGLRTNADGSCGSIANNYSDFGFVQLTMQTGSPHGAKDSLSMQYVSSRDGSTLDSFTIYKDPPKFVAPTEVSQFV